MKTILLSIIILVLLFVLDVLFTIHRTDNAIDEQTKILCRIYADRDHEKEIAPERWEQWSSDFKAFDWYQSCLNHIKHSSY